MVRVFFPNFFMRLMQVNTATAPVQAVFRVPPRMTKTEVKEYLTKIYDLPVAKVHTMNYQGKWKRFWGAKKVVAYKRRNFKKAIVMLEDSYKPSEVILARFPQATQTAKSTP